MAETLRILHYINQFYGGIGGEDKASVGLSAKDGPVKTAPSAPEC